MDPPLPRSPRHPRVPHRSASIVGKGRRPQRDTPNRDSYSLSYLASSIHPLVHSKLENVRVHLFHGVLST